MILQPGLIGDWHKDKATLATVAARAKLGIPPTLYLPTTNLEAKCAAIKEIDRQSGCGFAIHLNFGSKWWAGNDRKTGKLKSPLGRDAAWQEEMAELQAALATISRTMWGIERQMDVANGARFELLIRAILLEDEWRINANDPKALYTNNATHDMLAAIARRWSQRIASLWILGPSHDLICYGRGYNDSWTFQEEHGGNRLDVGRNVYRVAERAKWPNEYIEDQVGYLEASKDKHNASTTTAWLTLGLGYDANGKWHDDGPELYKPLVSGQVGRLLKGKVDNVVLYRVASEAHLRAFMRGYQGPAASRLKKS